MRCQYNLQVKATEGMLMSPSFLRMSQLHPLVEVHCKHCLQRSRSQLRMLLRPCQLDGTQVWQPQHNLRLLCQIINLGAGQLLDPRGVAQYRQLQAREHCRLAGLPVLLL